MLLEELLVYGSKTACNLLADHSPRSNSAKVERSSLSTISNGTVYVSGDNGRISYSITSGDEKGDFEIADNGTILTKRQLDREAQGLYNLVVTATDQAAAPEQRLSSTVQVNISSMHCITRSEIITAFLLAHN